jgi:hypothetical protein
MKGKKKKRCSTILNLENKERCKREYYWSIKVRLFHPFSKRKSWQKWDLCKIHYMNFLESEGKGWSCFRKKLNDHSPVIDYKLLEEWEIK